MAAMRKEWMCGAGNALLSLDTIDLPEGPMVVALSFYARDGRMPGFNMCFPLETWKDFQREVADYEPES
jgi:hypothetical protein